MVGDGVRRGYSFKLFRKKYQLDVGKLLGNGMSNGIVTVRDSECIKDVV